MLSLSFEGVEAKYTKPIPESIRNLSADELKAIEKRIVRKADMIMMYVFLLGLLWYELTCLRPIMGLLYILNCKL